MLENCSPKIHFCTFNDCVLVVKEFYGQKPNMCSKLINSSHAKFINELIYLCVYVCVSKTCLYLIV